MTALLTLDITAIGVPAANATVARNWMPSTIGSAPSARFGAALIGDQEKAVLFGGSTGTSVYADDTWTYDGGTFQWTYRNLVPRPSGRAGAATAFDFNGGYGVMFGGFNGTGTLADTWLYDFYTHQWIDGTPAAGPSPAPRHGAMMAHAVNDILLFGGINSTGAVLSDTWMYNVAGRTWTQLSPKTSPYGDAYASMTSSGFLSLANRSYQGPVLLGPDGPGGSYGTWTWEWSSEIPSGYTWVQQSPSVSPPPRSRAAMTFDTGARDVVLFGGRESGGAYRADTWTYDGVTWTEAAPVTVPSARADSALATVRFGSSSLLLFGGTGPSGRLGDSWLYRTPVPPTAPTGLVATAGDRQVGLTWTAPTNNGGTPIVGYNVYVGSYSGGQAATPVNGSTPITATSFTATGLTNLTTYWFVVTAVNAAGESVPSNEVSAQPTAAPVAVNDAYTTAEDTALVIAAPGVLSNDTVGTGTLTVSAHTAPGHGTVSIGADGGFTYTPAANYHGTDSFTYTARDAVSRTSTATVTITVSSVYDPPVAVDDAYMTTQDAALEIPSPGVLGNDTAVDGTRTVNSNTEPAHGTLTLNADGSFVYTPTAGWFGEDTFTYTLGDGTGGTATATVTITVTSALHTGDFWTNNNPVHKPSLWSSGGDFGGAMAPDYIRGTVVYFASNGVTWTWDGSDWIARNPTTVPDPRSGFSMAWDGYKVILFGGSDADSNILNSTWAWDGSNWLLQREYGTARPSLRRNAQMAWDANLNAVVLHGGEAANSECLGDTWLWRRASNSADREQWGSWTNAGTGPSPTRCKPRLASDGDGGVVLFGGRISDWPNPDRVLADTWTFQGIGTSANPYRWVRMSPATSPDARQMQGMALDASTGNVLLFGGWISAAWVSDDQTWTWDRGDVTWTREYPTASPTANSQVIGMVPDPGTGGVLYVGSAPGYVLETWTWFDDRVGPDTSITSGPSSLTNATTATIAFTAQDNVPSGDVTFACRLDGADPTACVSPMTFQDLTDGTHTFEVAATDTRGLQDSTPATRTWVVDTAPPETTILTHPPDPTPRTDAVFTFTGGDDVTAVGGLVFTCSLDGGEFLTCVSPKKYTGLAYGSHTFQVRARDGAGNLDPDPASFSWVAEDTGNTAPTPANDAYTTVEDTVLIVSAAEGVLRNDTDADTDQTLTALLVTATTHGALVLQADGSFTYAPALNYHGTDTFTYQASDGIVEVTATATITVTPVNDAPIARPDSYSGAEDWLLTVPSYDWVGVLANDTDVEGDALTAALVDEPVHGTLTLNANGSFTYMPDKEFFGIDTFTYTASDATGTSEPATVTINVQWMEDEPVAIDDAYETAAGTTLTVPAPGFLGNDINDDKTPGDPDWKDLIGSVESMPSHGTLLLDPDPYGWGGASGGFSYTPAPGFVGVDTFRYYALNVMTSWYSWETLGTVTITVTATGNAAPVAADDIYTTDEDTTLIVSSTDGVLANDSDTDGDTLSATLVTGVGHGTLTLETDGSFTYVPAPDYHGTDTFTYTASDGRGGTDTATVTITVTAVNDAPVAVADAWTVGEDFALTVLAPAVLANDSDVDGDTLTAIGVDQPAHGTVTLKTTGSFTYVPTLDFNGTDSFTYRAFDGQATSDVVTVTITVTPRNDPPVFDVIADQTVPLFSGDHTVAITGISPGPADEADQTVVFDGTSSDTAVVGDPTFTAGSLSLTPVAPGTATITVVADDGQATNNTFTRTFVVTVPVPDCDDNDVHTIDAWDPEGGCVHTPTNTSPVAIADSYSTAEDTQLNVAAPGVLGNDTDPDADALTATLTTLASHGSLTLEVDGSFTYTPAPDFNGTDTFAYTAADGYDGADDVVVTITVTPVNDRPVAVDDDVSVAEDSSVTVSPLVNDHDVDSTLDPSRIAVEIHPLHGTATARSDGTILYRPSADYHGPDTFQYSMCESGPAPYWCARAWVSITVTPVNDAPVAGDDTATTAEDTALVLAPAELLANDSDVDGDLLSITVLADPVHGTVQRLTDPPYAGSIEFLPDPDYFGEAAFVYTVSDGTLTATATVTITVTPVNDPPVAGDDTATTAEDSRLALDPADLLVNDSDVDSDTLAVTAVADAVHGTVQWLTEGPDVGMIEFLPDPDFAGAASFVYTVSDGTLTDTATVTITVTPVNDPPVAVADSYDTDEDTVLTVLAGTGVLDNDSDVDSASLSATLIALADHGSLTFDSDGSFTYTPDANFHGADTFGYVVSDGSLSDTATVTITVTPVNDPPVAGDDTATTPEDTALVLDPATPLANDSDLDGDSLAITGVSDAVHGAVQWLTEGPDVGRIEFLPDPDFSGAASFVYTVSDGTLTDTATVTITVTPVNDAPVGLVDSYTTDEDTVLSEPAAGVLGNDRDVDGDTLSAIGVGLAAHGMVALASDGSFTYTPDANFHGTDTFGYRAYDGQVSSDVMTVTITVTPVNDPPVVTLAPTTRSVQYSDQIAPVTVTVTDIDSTEVTVVPVGLPDDLTIDAASCQPSGPSSTCVVQITGAVFVPAGSYAYSVGGNDGMDDGTPVSGSITVTAESATVAFDADNPVSAKVDEGEESASGLEMVATVVETEPDLADGTAAAGDLANATVAMSLVPVGPGSPIPGTCQSSSTGTGYEQARTVTCTFPPVPVNTYTVEVSVAGGYYAGSGEDVFTVYDPDAGFATGGGWFAWPGTGDRTTFGFTMKYNKKGTSVQGSLLLIRHLPDGSIYRVKSNALYGLAVGTDSEDGVTFGWASFSGKSTYLEPGWLEPIGNQEFVVVVTDRNEPGTGVDTFQIRMLTQPDLALGEAVEIGGGNIVVPHATGGGRKTK